MASSNLDLHRSAYLTVGGTTKNPYRDYLSPKYLNIKYLLPASKSYIVDASDQANAPGIAFKFYGSVDYWWVVCMYNGILDPITEFKPGLVLQLPSLSSVNAFLSAQDTQQLNAPVTI
jgi:hypothetical protein